MHANGHSIKAKFHYASWFGAGSELAPNRFGAGSKLVRAEIWPIIQLASSKLARANRFAAKFHYAVWFGAGSELVRSWFEAGSMQIT